MNPFNNRWVALFSILGLLLIVAELIGTGEHGGVLSQAATSYAASDGAGEDAPEAPVEVIHQPPTVIEEVPEEDLPQVMGDDAEDTGDFTALDDMSEAESADNAPIDDAPIEDDSSEG